MSRHCTYDSFLFLRRRSLYLRQRQRYLFLKLDELFRFPFWVFSPYCLWNLLSSSDFSFSESLRFPFLCTPPKNPLWTESLSRLPRSSLLRLSSRNYLHVSSCRRFLGFWSRSLSVLSHFLRGHFLPPRWWSSRSLSLLLPPFLFYQEHWRSRHKPFFSSFDSARSPSFSFWINFLYIGDINQYCR